MKKIIVPEEYNYISAFLTFACGFGCKYCINKFSGLYNYQMMNTKDWIQGLNRIKTTDDRPITITGGEPTVHKDFYKIVKGIDPKISLDLLTNGDFDVEEFMNNIEPERMMRKAEYASIRFSYHPDNTNLDSLMWVVSRLQRGAYSVGIWAVDTGNIDIGPLQHACTENHIDLRLKEYLDRTHGSYRYPQAMDGRRKKCKCKPSEMLIAPDGRLFRCHRDLYQAENSYGHLLDEKVKLPTDFLPCDNHGLCNPCDVKTKYSRHQVHGHCAVEIKEIGR